MRTSDFISEFVTISIGSLEDAEVLAVISAIFDATVGVEIYEKTFVMRKQFIETRILKKLMKN